MKERQTKLPVEIEKLQSEAALNYAKAQSEAGAAQMEQMAAKMDMMLEQQRMSNDAQQAQLNMQLQMQKSEDARRQSQLDHQNTQEEQRMEFLKLVQSSKQAEDGNQLERERMAHEGAEATKERAHGEVESGKDRDAAEQQMMMQAKLKPKGEK